MNVRLAVILSLSILVIAENGEKNENRRRGLGRKEVKDQYTIVDETNQIKFGVPIGTKLKLDRKTQLYKPPKLFGNFTADQRMFLQYVNNVTSNAYCKVGPGKLKHKSRYFYIHHWQSWCRDSDGEDLCCDSRICNCNVLGIDCECKKWDEIF